MTAAATLYMESFVASAGDTLAAKEKAAGLGWLESTWQLEAGQHRS
jgi:hypothetical protein